MLRSVSTTVTIIQSYSSSIFLVAVSAYVEYTFAAYVLPDGGDASVVRVDLLFVTYILPSACALTCVSVDNPTYATTDNTITARPASHFTDSFTASVLLN